LASLSAEWPPVASTKSSKLSIFFAGKISLTNPVATVPLALLKLLKIQMKKLYCNLNLVNLRVNLVFLAMGMGRSSVSVTSAFSPGIRRSAFSGNVTRHTWTFEIKLLI